jgi:hypothetical protein
MCIATPESRYYHQLFDPGCSCPAKIFKEKRKVGPSKKVGLSEKKLDNYVFCGPLASLMKILSKYEQ